ncbi:MAG: M20/M25/M40 family metallo-hydrolase [Lentisphaeria bacterium]|nr:M20/M25/M40 family metallo-hydrolase [Lentisphaeria bacterium]
MKDSIALLQELIALRPVSADIPAVNRATDLLHAYLAAGGAHCRIEDCDGRRVLYAATTDTQTPALLLNAHVDVVPAADQQFIPREVDGWLHGRGGADCLGHAVICAQTVLRNLGKASVGAIFSADEEIGGLTTRDMVQRGYGATRLILVVDGGCQAIAVAQKGILSLTLTATGKPAHSSTPWAGDNAIDRLLDGYQKIRHFFPAVQPGDEWHNTLVTACIQGGTAHNRVPDEARMTINIRYIDPDERDTVIERLREQSGLQVDVLMECPPVVFPENTPAFADLAACMKQELGCDIAFKRMNGATDARHFAVLGVPVAIVGARGRDVHGNDEAVEIASLRQYEELFTVYARQIAGVSHA